MLNVYAVDITIEWVLLTRGKTAKKLVFEEVDFPIEEESEIIKIMRLDVESHIKGYHIYKRLEPENVVARFACSGSGKRRSNSWTSKQGNLGRFGKTIFFSYV